MNRQKGLTLTGLLVVSVIIIFVLLLGFKLLPAYTEYKSVEKIFKAMAEDPAMRGARREVLERSWAARATVENIQAVDGSVIEYNKEPDGGWLINAEYSVKIPLIRNVNACIDFKPSSK